jgi:hypothetical protein
MYSTGKIGFWSLMELGIGIIAGSLPALRPLLSLRVGFSSSVTPGGAAASGNTFPSSRSRQPDSRAGNTMMDTFHPLGDNEDVEFGDGDSQRNIMKETRYTVTSADASPHAGDRKQFGAGP